MNLQSLVVADDEKTVRVLRRVLSDLDIDMEHCSNPETAVQQLTRNRFEAVIVDCSDTELAGRVLKSARLAPCNRRAVALAIVDANMPLRTAFEMGAHFVLYKPVSAERAKSSFRAARALMKRERRRNTRIPVEMPVTVRVRRRRSCGQVCPSATKSEFHLRALCASRHCPHSRMHRRGSLGKFKPPGWNPFYRSSS